MSFVSEEDLEKIARQIMRKARSVDKFVSRYGIEEPAVFTDDKCRIAAIC